MKVLLYLHVIAATIWVGGLIVIGSLVPAVRTATPDRAVLRAMARRFGMVSWAALAVLVVTGPWMVAIGFNWSTTLTWKVSLVVASAILAFWHSVAAKNQTPATRGLIQATLLLLALVIVGLAINI